MAQIRIYSDIVRGFIEYTGNTIEAITSASQESATGIGTGPPGGQFTALSTWRTNGSAAFLRGLAGSTVIKAYLAWMGTPIPDNNGTSTNQNIAVTFTTPLGSNSITGNPAWSQQNNIVSQQFNIRVADVTTIVKAAGTGQYSVVGIPSASNYGGWTLMVVWGNSSLTTRFISIDTYDDLVSSSLSFTVGGFITPTTGAVNGRAAMVVGSAENYTSSGPTKFGRTAATLATLSGPNNPAAIFFQMQINNADSESATVGQLDTTGTLGTYNAPLNQASLTPNCRWHWDQTNVSLNPGLTNAQTSGVFQFGPVNNTYAAHLISLQIDAQAPEITNTKSVDKTLVEVGETFAYTVVVRNTGTFGTNNLILIDTLPNQTTFVNGTVVVDGVSQPSASPVPPSGFDIGSIAIGQTHTVTFQVRATSGQNTTAINAASVNYTYTPIAGTTLVGGVTSNSVNTLIAANVTIVNTKTVNKNYGDLGDTLLYTIRLANTGSGTATSLKMVDTLPNGTTFITNSLTLNGVTQTGATPFPPTGFTIGTLAAGGVATITFSVRVNTTLPTPNPIPNTAYASTTYTVDPSVPNGRSTGITSNSVTTQINNVSIPSLTKAVDKAFAKVGDTLLYTLVFTTSGNTLANNIIIKDTIPNNTTFVANSITINGTTQTGATIAPPTGLSVGTVPAGTTTTVTFIVQVNTIPTPNPIPNNANLTYSYITDPSVGTSASSFVNANQVTTRVNTAIIGTTKSTNISNGFVGDTVLYTLVLRNSGNTTATNITLFDTIPRATSFVTDSVTVNGTTQTGINPQTNGVTLPDLPVGGVATVTFRVVIDTIPSPNPTTNASTTQYSYLLDSSTPTTTSATNNSNIVDTYVNPNTNPLKIVSQDHGTIGTTLTYTIAWRNVTNETQFNVTFVDTLPNGVTFIPNTVAVNGVTLAGGTITPPNGINTGTLPVNSVMTVTYQVVVNTIPTPNPIPNTASVTNTGVGGTQTFETNQVTTDISYAQLGVVSKSVDKGYATVGETVLYTIVLSNTGNTTANNVVITDTIPSGTTFVTNTVTVDGTSQPGAVVAPPTGLTLSSIPAGKVTTITFQVSVVSIPSPNRALNSAHVTNTFVIDPVIGTTQTQNNNTNITTTTIIDATLVNTKTVSKTYSNVGDTLTYTVVLTYTGNTTANNVIFTDSLPSTVTYVTGTFALNGVPIAGGNPLSQGIGSLTVPATYTITFNAVVNTVPNPNPITNTATTTYTYTLIPTLPNGQSRGNTTNTANTNVNNASLGGITKSVDKAYADCGDTITYTINIPNSGNVTATNVVFKDTIPNGTAIVANSVYVNGVQQVGASPTTGISLGNIAPGATTSVVFSVVVQC